MLSLKSFHLVFISASIILAAWLGAWGLLNQNVLLGVVSLSVGVLLVGYEGYFEWKANKAHLD